MFYCKCVACACIVDEGWSEGVKDTESEDIVIEEDSSSDSEDEDDDSIEVCVYSLLYVTHLLLCR